MLDATGAHTLAEIAEELEERGITVIAKGVQAEHRKLLANMGIFEALRHENHLVDSLDEAVAHARSHVPAGVAPQASSMSTLAVDASSAASADRTRI